jgi:hypothetical protein
LEYRLRRLAASELLQNYCQQFSSLYLRLTTRYLDPRNRHQVLTSLRLPLINFAQRSGLKKAIPVQINVAARIFPAVNLEKLTIFNHPRRMNLASGTTALWTAIADLNP